MLYPYRRGKKDSVKASPALFVQLLLTIGLIVGILRWGLVQSRFVADNAANFDPGQYNPTPLSPSIALTYTPSSFISPSVSTVSPIVSPVAITPTFTVTPTPAVVDFGQYLYEGRLSFYDPEIGRYFPDIASVNCADWDSVNKVCNSKLLYHQMDYSDWYGRGVACPPALPDLAVLRVVYPEQLAGDWACVDRGDAVTDNWLDFLLRYPDQVWTGANLNNFPWGSPVKFYVGLPR